MPAKRHKVKLNCFVAMAFGREDTDSFFEKSILPAAKSAINSKPNRVDRNNSNDTIDNKIYRHMEACDICIADLTYARPSVYYESGYVRGMGKPVIFTARQDYLDRIQQDGDPQNVLRVHFDLEHESIIGWDPEEPELSTNRLVARLNSVSLPIKARIRRSTEENEAKTFFANLSSRSKLSSLQTCIRSHTRQLGWEQQTTSGWDFDKVNWHGVHKNPYPGLFSKVSVHTSVTKASLRSQGVAPFDIGCSREVSRTRRGQGLSLDEMHELKPQLIYHQYLFLVSIRNLPATRVSEYFSVFHRSLRNDNLWYHHVKFSENGDVNIAYRYVYVIDNITSILGFESDFEMGTRLLRSIMNDGLIDE